MERSVFIVEDDMFYATILNEELKQSGITNTKIFYTGNALLESLDEQPDIVLLDHKLGDANGVDLLKVIKSKCPETEVIFLSGQEDLSVAVKALKFGAYDYVEKNANAFARVKRLIAKMDQLKNLIKENEQIKRAKTIAVSAIAVFFGVLILLNNIYPRVFVGL